MTALAKNAVFLTWRIVRQHAKGFTTVTVVATVTAIALHQGVGREWVMSGLPAWLQAVGTCLACGLAWVAYTNWRRQELAKRKAGVAEKILQSAQALANAMTRLPCIMWGRGAPINEAGVAGVADDQERKGIIEAMMPPAAQLRTYLPLTRVYFGEEAHSLVERLVHHVGDMREAMGNIEAAAEGDAPAVYGDEDAVIDDLKAVGVYTYRDREEFRSAHQEIHNTMNNIEKILQPFMCYDDALAST